MDPLTRRRTIRAVVAALLVAANGFAEDRSVGTPALDRAEAEFRQGTAAFEAGAYSDAFASLRAAWDLAPSYRTAGGLGQVELHLGQYRDAATHLAACLRMFPTGAAPDAKRNVEQGLAAARAHVGGLRVHVDVPGAAIYVDRVLVGHAPMDELLFVDPGHRVIDASAPNHDPTAASVDAMAGSTHDVTLTLGAETPQRRSSFESAAVAPATPARSAAPGDRAPGDGDGVAPSTWALGVGGVITLALATTAGVFAAKSMSASSDADVIRRELAPTGGCAGATSTTDARCAKLADLVSDRNHDNAWVTAASMGAGAAALVTVGAYFVLSPRKRAHSPGVTSWGTLPTPGGASIFVRGDL